VRRTARALPATLALLLGVIGGMGCFERIIFQPSRGVGLTPQSLGIHAEEVFLTSEDGVKLHAFQLPARGEPLGLSLLFLHGNAGNASHRLPNADQLAALGVDVLLLDYRGYGRSEGRPSEDGVYADGRAALRHLTEAQGVPQDRLVLFGRSLGGAVAVELARNHAVAGVILESTFSSAGDVAKRVLGFPLGPLLRQRFDSSSKIGDADCPVLFIHGDQDDIIPIELGQKLFRSALEPKWFETVHGAGHNDLVIIGGAPYFRRISDFLRRDLASVAEG